jgi:hypothetical protein
LEDHYYHRNAAIRAALARAHVFHKLLDDHPKIHTDPEMGRQRFLLTTDGVGITDKNTDPCGVVFCDHSFLTIYEEWSKPDNRLLAYSYHYQRRDLSIRYDMDEEEKEKIPKCHVQFSAIEKIHAPCAGRVNTHIPHPSLRVRVFYEPWDQQTLVLRSW